MPTQVSFTIARMRFYKNVVSMSTSKEAGVVAEPLWVQPLPGGLDRPSAVSSLLPNVPSRPRTLPS